MSSRKASKRSATQSQSSNSSSTTSKKTKLAFPDVDGFKVRFEWEGDQEGSWVQYTEKFNKLLTEAYNSDKEKVELSVPSGAKMIVMFDKMIQKNKKTGWERKVRVGLMGPKDKKFMVTMWQDEGNKWCSYTVGTCMEIAKAVGSKKSALVTSSTPTPYDIDLKKMTQTNIQTQFNRKIKREIAVSDTPPDDDADDNEENGKDEKVDSKTDVKKEVNGSGKTKLTKKGSGSTKAVKQEEDAEEVKAKSGQGKTKSSGAKGSVVRTVVVKKGSAPVDSLCPIANKVSVYESCNVIWDAMLNQTNIANNNNKYFLCQLLKEDGKDAYHVWFRWGRVGYNGQNSLNNCGGSLDAAKKTFEKKFKDKTSNDWALRDCFEKVPGKYDLLKMDYSGDKDEDQVDSSIKTEVDEDIKTPDSKLDKKLQDLINLICNIKSMEAAVVEMKYDAKKAPLGKLTKAQIKAGYAALKKIEGLLEKNDTGRGLQEACSEFYTRIPHWFGMQTPPLIRTPQMVKEKLSLLEALEDIEIAIKMLKGGDRSENPVDRHYHQLKCKLDTVDHQSEDFQLVSKYLQYTHAGTHNQYKMELLDVFKCNKDGEDTKFLDLGNKMLLWHGSRLTNWAGILGEGLRIAPPEAPVTGYMFGKGVYFADMSSKSANYCFATRSKNIGLLLLCEVSLGSTEDKLAADYNSAKLPKGKHSVRGLGKIAPDPKDNFTLSDGVVCPVGKPKDTGVVNPSGYTLNYNEFIVYDTKQIRMKYLVQVKFNFK